ncbi:ZIP family metal transporter [Methylomarinum sp. Ch1-1]|uniref:ZIP family metal transporter n=1 Tax=Methylomarinum roseum TaxID=3067653 RepID=A0AAU7NRJ8_9GAMM|nr:ZIP family metal transporter [Methylomarinum sp. Ch1-1]MDP4520416.1 ZIP family metal transporter [Methylomarinum sp. Ch1-1]
MTIDWHPTLFSTLDAGIFQVAFHWFAERSHILQALLAALFTWGMTALGAALVFFTKRINQKLLDAMLGFSGGVMLAASYWSLLAPAIDLSQGYGALAWFPAALGFGLGAFVLSLSDKLLPHFQLGASVQTETAEDTTWRRTLLLVFAITLHNIPEGLAVGVAFGALACGFDSTSLGAAIALALGIGLQNFPEGSAVALPLRRAGWSQLRSFYYGQLSAVVEPIAAVIGAAAVTACMPIMPYALAFAAGAMIYVVIDAVIPESRDRGNTEIATLGAIVGFIVMMVLDVALG